MRLVEKFLVLNIKIACYIKQKLQNYGRVLYNYTKIWLKSFKIRMMFTNITFCTQMFLYDHNFIHSISLWKLHQFRTIFKEIIAKNK